MDAELKKLLERSLAVIDYRGKRASNPMEMLGMAGAHAALVHLLEVINNPQSFTSKKYLLMLEEVEALIKKETDKAAAIEASPNVVPFKRGGAPSENN